MTSIEPRSLFELRQKLRRRDAGRFEKRSPHSKNIVLSPKNGDCPTNCILHHASKRHIGFICVCLGCATRPAISLRDFSKPNFKLQSKNGLVHRMTMYGHLTCPEELWHVSDKQIGTILNHDKYLHVCKSL